MNPYISYLNQTVNKNTQELQAFKGDINWANSATAYRLEMERNELLENLKGKAQSSYKNSKLWYRSLSKGCELCAAGSWSCLFITNVCNATCAYCPTQQDNDEIPATQGSSFKTPEEYADYINFFDFKGVSVSGGEPLKTFDKTVDYIKAVRKYCSKDIYIWVYTNGILGTEEKFKTLGEIGVNEVRFNLGASNYNLSLIKNAKPYIQNLTVEIPAIPEDFEKLKTLVPELIEAGVTNLNLHQLRLTAYNAPRLTEKPYTFIHGNPATVAETELTALNMLQYLHENQFPLGMNYCNYHYKNNFQKAGFRKQIAQKFMTEKDEITEKGFLRTLLVKDIHGIEKEICLNELEMYSPNHPEVNVQYHSFLFSDEVNDFNQSERFYINEKPYIIQRMKLGKSFSCNTNSFIKNLTLITGKDIVLEDEFSIFSREKIETELPEYF